MLIGSRRRRRCRSGLGDEAVEIVSAIPFRLLIEGFPVTIDAVELDGKEEVKRFDGNETG